MVWRKYFIFVIVSLFIISFVGSDGTVVTDVLVKYDSSSSNIYRTPDGHFKTVYQPTEINYLKDGKYKPYNLSIKNTNKTDYEYEFSDDGISYKTYFQDDIKAGKGLRFELDGYWFNYDLSGGKIQWSEQPGNPTKTKSIGAILSSSPYTYGNIIQYNNSFSNTHVQYKILKNGVKENFILNSNPGGSTGYLYLEYVGEVEFDNNLTIWANDEIQTSKSFNTTENIEFKDLSNKTIFQLPEPIATDSSGNSINLIYDIKPNTGKLTFSLKTPVSFLDNATYPIYIDPSVTYNFNSTYEGINMFAYEWDNAGCGDQTPPSSYPFPCSPTSGVSITTSSGLNANDGSYVSTSSDDSILDDGIQLFEANLSRITKTDITLLNWTWDGKTANTYTSDYIYFYLYNTSSPNWTLMDSTNSNSDVTKNIISNDNNIINSTSYTHLALVVEDTIRAQIDLYTDFVQLSVTYDDLIVNSPTTNQEILNNLSTVLNTSQAGYNNTIWYTWNSGIKNTTLCTDSNECQATITFPRQGYYNLTIWANKSDGTIISKNVNNLFVGNQSNIINTTLGDVYATTVYGYFDNPLIKFDLSPLNNYNVHGNSTFVFYGDPDQPGSYNPTIIYTTNQTWTESISCANFNSLSEDGIYNTQINQTSLLNPIWFEFDLSTFLKNNIDSGYKNFSFYFYFNEKDCSTNGGGIFDDVNLSYDSTSGSYGTILFDDKETSQSNKFIRVKYSSLNTVPTLTNTLSNNSNFSVSTVNFTFNISDDNDYLTNISIFIDGILNTTSYQNYPITANTNNSLNISLSGIQDGLHNWSIQSYDSDGAQSNSSTFTFRLDSTPPVSTADATPYTFNTWTKNNVTVTITAYDSGIGFDNLAYPKYCNDSTNTCNPTDYIGGGVTIYSEGTSYIRYYSNDTLNNNESIKNQTIKIDKTVPNLTVLYPTSGLNLSTNTSINLNFSVVDSISSVDSCWYSLNSGITNFTVTNCLNATFNTSEGNKLLYFYVNDSANNVNVTSINFTTDLTIPNATLISPTNNTFNSSTSQNFTVNLTDNLGNKNFTLYVWNESGLYNQTSSNLGSGVINSIKGIVVEVIEGIYKWWVSVWDWAGNTYTTQNNTLTIDTTIPLISITSPLNNTNTTDTSLDINLTVSDTYLSSCWYSNDTMTLNTSISCGTNITTVTWAEGLHNVTIWVNDTSNNVNSTSVRFRIDTTAPSLSIVYPEDLTTYGTNNLSLNYTVSDLGVGVQSCWYRNNTDANNISIVCGTNTTISQGSDGNYIVYMWANDTLGNTASDSHTYSISTTSPATTLKNPSNNSYLNSSLVLFNYTSTDSEGVDTCQLWGNWSGWHLNQSKKHSGDTSVSISEGNFSQTLVDGNYYWNIWCNDTLNLGGFYVSNWTFTVDTINPLISYGTGTLNNDTNTTANSIYVNVSITEINENTITFTLSNATSQINKTSFTDKRRNINWTSLVDDVYYYNVTINDSAGKTNFTPTRLIRLDDTKPTINIAIPLAQNYGINNSISLNHTTTDNLIGLSSCWYYIQNSSGSTIITTQILSTCQNTTFSLPSGDINYNLYFFAKDLLDNTQTNTLTFRIRTNSPSVVLTTVNDTQSNSLTNNYFNFSVTTNADNISNCSLYGNWSGWALNQTINNPSESTDTSFNSVTLSEGEYYWNVLCTDNFNYKGWALNNNTYIIDRTIPLVSITSITTTQGSQTISFNTNTTDLHSVTCKYSIYDGILIDGLNKNVSFTCGSPTSATVTDFGTFSLKYYAMDKSGNENSTSSSFITSASTTTPTGGGGATTSKVKTVTVIAITIPENMTLPFSVANNLLVLSKLERAIIYSRLKEHCEEFSVGVSSCELLNDAKKSLIDSLEDENIKLDMYEITAILKAYNENNIEEFDVELNDAEKYNLYKATLSIVEQPLVISPRTIDRIFLITSPSSVFEYPVKSNKVLESVSIDSDDKNLIIEQDTDTTATLKYKLSLLDFNAKTIKGTVNYVSAEGESVFQEVQIRAFYLFSFNFLAIFLLLILSMIVIYKKKETINIYLKDAKDKLKIFSRIKTKETTEGKYSQKSKYDLE